MYSLLRFGVFVRLVANVVAGLAAVRVHALNHRDICERALPGVGHDIDASSQGMDSESSESTCAAGFPVTSLPSFNFQVGPADCCR